VATSARSRDLDAETALSALKSHGSLWSIWWARRWSKNVPLAFPRFGIDRRAFWWFNVDSQNMKSTYKARAVGGGGFG